MKLFSQIVLAVAAALLMAYPLWGVLFPGSYVVELQDHHTFAPGASHGQIAVSAAMLWAANGTLAAALLLFAVYLQFPWRRVLLTLSASLLVLYPLVRTVVEVLIGLNLTAHVEGATVGIELSSEKAFYLVFGIALMGVAAVIPEKTP